MDPVFTDSQRLPFVLKKLEQTERVVDQQAAEIARLRKAIVYSVEHAVGLGLPDEGLEYWIDTDDEYSLRSIPCDGTPEQIVATVCRLAEEQ